MNFSRIKTEGVHGGVHFGTTGLKSGEVAFLQQCRALRREYGGEEQGARLRALSEQNRICRQTLAPAALGDDREPRLRFGSHGESVETEAEETAVLRRVGQSDGKDVRLEIKIRERFLVSIVLIERDDVLEPEFR